MTLRKLSETAYLSPPLKPIASLTLLAKPILLETGCKENAGIFLCHAEQGALNRYLNNEPTLPEVTYSPLHNELVFDQIKLYAVLVIKTDLATPGVLRG